MLRFTKIWVLLLVWVVVYFLLLLESESVKRREFTRLGFSTVRVRRAKLNRDRKNHPHCGEPGSIYARGLAYELERARGWRSRPTLLWNP